ncbi:hypothetical protein PQ465_07450 [Sphingobacterium oryzagri]|uniref:Fimbrillin family protein n=1 Tax=Sphingobacterium oryzagri TaxID=3025669 RepID=A0ABY7WKU2_9SPHI|nr:hypothetical protein [Sphingobacterium sp. KACC 22765]WDF70204.1 hypothetical protein PQ465_07450 [Sphingobacterium sp. KACC 22765]
MKFSATTFTNSLKTLCMLLPCFVFTFALYSCRDNENQTTEVGQATVSITMLGSESEVEDSPLPSLENRSSIQRAATSSPVADLASTVALDEYHALDVRMETLSSASGKRMAHATATDNRSATGNMAAARIVNTPLANGIRYKLVVYNDQGVFVTEKDYVYGQTTSDLLLDAGKVYTFIAYSINSTNNDLPTVSNRNLLTTAMVNNVSADLMYFIKERVTLTFGDNNLAITLKHKYAQITTRITMDDNTTGNITRIVTPTISSTYANGNLKLSDGTVTYNGAQNTSVPVQFSVPATGTRNIASQPTLLVSPTNPAGVLRFSSITIDGETKTNITVPNVNIYPGSRYNLNLTFKTCTEAVSGVTGFNWNYPANTGSTNPGGITIPGTGSVPRGYTLRQQIVAPASDYGFVFDIYQLDNSFNMELNGVTLATKEIQFEPNIGDLPQNIRFRDGSRYQGPNTEGGANIGPVYNMTGTTAAPLIRVLIGRNGDVQILGSKVAGGPLYELELFDNNTFNTFRWNTNQDNVISVTQRVDGRTIMRGSGSGRKKVPCN